MLTEKAKEKQSEAGGAVRQKSDKAVVDTKKELAKVAGVSHDTIHKVEVIENSGDKELIGKVRNKTQFDLAEVKGYVFNCPTIDNGAIIWLYGMVLHGKAWYVSV